jgi:hypothetical protein
MRILRHLWHLTGRLFEQVRLFPQSVVVTLRRRRRQFALNALEAERLDRIRNPAKYLGK